MQLPKFLLARISEDEEFALRYPPTAAARPRALAECESKRQLVEDAKLAQEAYAALRDSLSGDTERERLELRAYGQAAFVWSGVLLQLALPYASHPDYCEEWRP